MLGAVWIDDHNDHEVCKCHAVNLTVNANKLLSGLYKPVMMNSYRSKSIKSGEIFFQCLTIADISPSACRNSTILLLCVGSTRANSRAFLTAFDCSSTGRSSNSRPVKAFPSVDSVSVKTPIRLQIASAVA